MWGARLVDWPVTHTIKCLSFYRPDDPQALKEEQSQKLRTLYEAARKVGRELLIEIIAGKHGTLGEDTIPRALEELYALGIKPDWWKLEPQATPRRGTNIGKVIDAQRPLCRGMVLLGLEAPEDELAKGFAAVAAKRHRQGLRCGPHHLQRRCPRLARRPDDDDAATADMAERFGNLVSIWNDARRA